MLMLARAGWIYSEFEMCLNHTYTLIHLPSTWIKWLTVLWSVVRHYHDFSMADYSSIQDYGPVLRDVTIGCVVPTTVIFFWRMGSKLPTFNNRIGFGFYDVMLALAMVNRSVRSQQWRGFTNKGRYFLGWASHLFWLVLFSHSNHDVS